MKSILSVLNTKHLWLIALPIALMLVACNPTPVPTAPLEASVGVHGKCGSNSLGTYFVFRITHPDGSSVSLNDLKISVVGPADWGTVEQALTTHNSLPVELSLDKKPIVGAYTVNATIEGTAVSRTLNLSNNLTRSSCPVASFQTQTPEDLTLNLTATTGLVSYRLSVIEASTDTTKKQSEYTTSTTPTINGLVGIMDATKFNWLELTSTNVDFSSATAPLPARVVKATKLLPVIVAPLGSSYNMSAAFGTEVDSRYPGRIFTSAVWELRNPNGSNPFFATYSYGLYPPVKTWTPFGILNGLEDAKPNAVGEQPFSAFESPVANTPYTFRVLVNGQRYEASNTIPNITQTLGFATNIRVTSATPSSVAVSWIPPSGGLSTEVQLYDSTGDFIDYKDVNTTSLTLNSFAAPLQVGATYRVFVISYNFDRKTNTNLPEQINDSTFCGTFKLANPTSETVLTPCNTFNLSQARSNSSEALSLPSFPSDRVFR
jgi:hypothetical protein